MMAQLRSSDSGLLEHRWFRVEVDRTVPVPPAQVWALVGDESTWLDWYEPLSGFEPVGEPTSGVGATFAEQEWVWTTASEVVVKDDGRRIDLATRSINLRGLLRGYYRRIELEPVDGGSSTEVSFVGGFRFVPLGWLLFPYTYPQMNASLWFEYRGALKGLASALDR